MTAHPYSKNHTIPPRAGVGLKAQHYHDILEHLPDISWFEVHPENYMCDGGAPHHYLTRIRENYPLSLHGVGLSLGGSTDLDIDHLQRLKNLIERYEPGLFSEHLAWASHDETYLNDLLPLPYTDETLRSVCQHIEQVQGFLSRQMLLENPATYVVFEHSTYSEIEFIQEIVKRTGCGLLFDVNNVYVSCTNHKRDPVDYIQNYPLKAVQEIHLAGHAENTDDEGKTLLIDSHDREVLEKVWDLYQLTLSLSQPKPTLVEWDANVPDWAVLFAQAEKAEQILANPHKSNSLPPTSNHTKDIENVLA
ncbi:MAG: DUF692 domain-containing protein [Pseudomonadota bacterium]